MNKFPKILIFLAIVILIGGSIYYFNKKRENETNTPDGQASIIGCYVAKLSKDVYTLNIES